MWTHEKPRKGLGILAALTLSAIALPAVAQEDRATTTVEPLNLESMVSDFRTYNEQRMKQERQLELEELERKLEEVRASQASVALERERALKERKSLLEKEEREREEAEERRRRQAEQQAQAEEQGPTGYWARLEKLREERRKLAEQEEQEAAEQTNQQVEASRNNAKEQASAPQYDPFPRSAYRVLSIVGDRVSLQGPEGVQTLSEGAEIGGGYRLLAVTADGIRVNHPKRAKPPIQLSMRWDGMDQRGGTAPSSGMGSDMSGGEQGVEPPPQMDNPEWD